MMTRQRNVVMTDEILQAMTLASVSLDRIKRSFPEVAALMG
jgi:hypothetical protein